MNIILFGAGMGLKKILQSGLLAGDVLLAVVDNNADKHGKKITYNGLEVTIMHPSCIQQFNVERIIVTVANKKYAISIIKQLRDMDISLKKVLLYEGASLTYCRLADQEYANADGTGHIFMDTTFITRYDTKTGIPRVINNLYENICSSFDNLMPIQWVGDYITSYAYKCRMDKTLFDGYEQLVSFTDKDVLFLPDTSWAVEDNIFVDAYKKHARIFPIIYDLIPLQLKDMFAPNFLSSFAEWIRLCLLYSDGIICISKTVANDIAEYFKHNGIQRGRSLPLFVIHLGSDIQPIQTEPRDSIRFFCNSKPTFLMVGVIGPQKNHKLVLRAFKKLLHDGNNNLHLLIIGRDAYDDKEFRDLYYSDEALQQNVMWVQDADDGELQWAYKNCTALLFASMAEGFGLPIAEASYFNLPLLLNDTPIFRELAGENAEYFNNNDESALSKALSDWMKDDMHPLSKKIKLHSWQDTTKEVLTVFSDKATPYMIL